MDCTAVVKRSHGLAALADAFTKARPATFQHANRVAHNAVRIGEALGLRGVDLMGIGWSGLLHDLGKIAVPNEILDKPGRLNAAEQDEVRHHPAIGEAIIRAMSEDLAPIAAAIGAHHERWDGNGYPNGLAGEAIPLAARIIEVVDVFDAMTCDRPYRSAPKSEADALAIVRNMAGTALDAQVVALFQELLIAGWLQVRDHDASRRHPVAV